MSNLCRLCAKVSTYFKDLLEESNKTILKVVQDFTHISVIENDLLPSTICLDCEETLVNFQLFVLECQKTQDIIRKTVESSEKGISPIKLENDSLETYGLSPVKYEVKDEFNADAIELFRDNFKDLNDDGDFNVDDCKTEDDLEDIAIASLQRVIAKKAKKKKELTFDETMKKSNPTMKDFVKLYCQICDVTFKIWNDMRNHFDKNHECTPLVTCLCGFKIRSKSVLYRHVSEHILEKKAKYPSKDDEKDENKYGHHIVAEYIKFVCRECKEEFSSWYKLKDHCDQFHDVLPVAFCKCGFQVRSKSSVYKHVKQHKDSSLLRCDICSKLTSSAEALERHKLRHIPKSERNFKCSKCDKVFRYKDGLKSHERSHIPIEMRRNYDCEVCGMKFTTHYSALTHRRVVHDKVKGFVCDQCGYACGTSGELRQHRAIHSADKPFKCSKCSKGFKTYANLKTHMDTHEDTAYECYICRRILNSRRTLRKHYLVHDDKCKHVCPYCNKAFKRRQTLVVHMHTHTGLKPLSCKLCGEKFMYASTLRTHRLRIHPETVQGQEVHAQGQEVHVQRHENEQAIEENILS